MINLPRITTRPSAINFQLLPNMSGIQGSTQGMPQVESNAHNPRAFMIPLQMERIKSDIESWRLAINEAENAYYPHRFKIQQLLVDVILEGHTKACIEKRKDMTLLKEFKIGSKNESGQWVENKEASKLFQGKKWFNDMLSYLIDAQFYGYTLIGLGDLVIKNKEYNFVNLQLIKRWHVSPDRKQFVQIPYQTWGMSIQDMSTAQMKSHDDQNGINFKEDLDENGVAFDDWMVYVDTHSDTGASICGYGLLYNVALYSILLKSNLGFNANYNQMFVAPYRHIKTDAKFDSDEYKALKASAAQMGSFGYLLTGMDDMVDFKVGNTGTGYQSYGNLEERLEKKVSKLLLGHSNALDPQKTALGGGAAGKGIMDEDASPEGQALAATEKKQNTFVLECLNNTVYPKLRKLGFPLKDGESFYTPNDKEEFEMRKKADQANLVTAQVWKTAKEGGLKMSSKSFGEITGIEAEEVEDPVPAPAFGGNKDGALKIAAKIKALYSHKH